VIEPATRPGNGYALIAAIVALTLIEILAIGLIAITNRARLSAEERAALTATRLAAESAIRQAVSGWDERALGFPGPGTRFTLATPVAPAGAPTVDLQAERLARGLVIVRATAWTAVANGVRATAAATLSAIPTDEARLDFHSALVSGGDVELVGNAIIDGTTAGSAPPPLQLVDCTDPAPTWPIAPGSPRPGVALAAGSTLNASATAVVAGSPAVLTGAPRTTPSSFLRLSRVPIGDVAAIADRVETGAVSLGPRTTGSRCDGGAPGNWGAPGNRAHPCFDYVPLVFAPAGLTIAGGEGQALLVVDGDLAIADGVVLRGAVLVTGRLTMGSAVVDGSIRVAGQLSRIAGSIRFDECSLVRALTLPPSLRAVYRVADRWWLPAW